MSTQGPLYRDSRQVCFLQNGYGPFRLDYTFGDSPKVDRSFGKKTFAPKWRTLFTLEMSSDRRWNLRFLSTGADSNTRTVPGWRSHFLFFRLEVGGRGGVAQRICGMATDTNSYRKHGQFYRATSVAGCVEQMKQPGRRQTTRKGWTLPLTPQVEKVRNPPV